MAKDDTGYEACDGNVDYNALESLWRDAGLELDSLVKAIGGSTAGRIRTVARKDCRARIRKSLRLRLKTSVATSLWPPTELNQVPRTILADSGENHFYEQIDPQRNLLADIRRLPALGRVPAHRKVATKKPRADSPCAGGVQPDWQYARAELSLETTGGDPTSYQPDSRLSGFRRRPG